MKAHLPERDLIKALDDQGFRIEETSDGYKVWPRNDTDKPVFFHASTLEKSPRSYQNVLTNLRGIGFAEPETVKRGRAAKVKKTRQQREDEERAAGPYLCSDCGDESKEYPFKRSLARHQQAARHGEYATIPSVLPTQKPKVKHDADELKAKRLMRKFKGLVAQLNETSDELITLVEPLEEENHKMRGKLKRLEGVVGKLVEEI